MLIYLFDLILGGYLDAYGITLEQQQIDIGLWILCG